MAQHSAIERVVERIRTDSIGGAADVSKEVIIALSEMVKDSKAEDTAELVDQIDEAVLEIMRVLPSFAPAVNALHKYVGAIERMGEETSIGEMKTELKDTADNFINAVENALEKVAKYGAEKVKDGNVVFMYSMSSTVWGIFIKAKSQGKRFSVVVTESRPSNEGLWTVEEMEKSGIPVSVSIDACMGELIPQCDAVFTGADVISSTGSALNKVGTYPAALIAKAHGVPVYIAADTLKFDIGTMLGLPYRNEPINRYEVIEDNYSERVQVVGHLFDETPPELITAVITEKGLMHPASAFTVIQQMQPSQKLNEMMPAWSRGEL